MVGQGRDVLGSTVSPHMEKNRKAFPYGLPPNYMPPTMHMPNENANHTVHVPFEGQQPQPVGGARKESQDHAQVDFEPYPMFATEGPTCSGML